MKNTITVPSGSTPISVLLSTAATLLGNAATAIFQIQNSQPEDGNPTNFGPTQVQSSFGTGLQDTVKNLQAQAEFYEEQGS